MITKSELKIKPCILCNGEADENIEIVKDRYEISVCKTDAEFVYKNIDAVEKIYTARTKERSITL